MKFCPDFTTNSREEWRVSLFQSNLRKQIRKLPKIQNSEICEKYSFLFIIIHSCPYSSLSRARSAKKPWTSLGAASAATSTSAPRCSSAWRGSGCRPGLGGLPGRRWPLCLYACITHCSNMLSSFRKISLVFGSSGTDFRK